MKSSEEREAERGNGGRENRVRGSVKRREKGKGKGRYRGDGWKREGRGELER